MPTLIGAAETCERIGIDRSTLTRWIQTGKIRVAQRAASGPKAAYLFAPDEVERARAEYAGDTPTT